MEQTGATLSTMTVRLADGRSTSGTPTNAAITAGGSYSSNFTFNDPSASSTSPTLSLSLSYTDAKGNSGVVTGAANVAQIQRSTLLGVITDGASGKGLQSVSVTVTDSAGTSLSATSDGNGYYAIPGVAQGAATVRSSLSAYDTVSQSATIAGETRVDLRMNKTAAPSPAVEYRITGTARRCSATYQNSTGGTNQAEVNIPFSYTWSSARTNDFLYMSCQIDTGGDQGNITVAIYKNGSLYRSAQASGFPNIATASGSF